MISCSVYWNLTQDEEVQRLELAEVGDGGGHVRRGEIISCTGEPLFGLFGTEFRPGFIGADAQNEVTDTAEDGRDESAFVVWEWLGMTCSCQ